MKENNFIGIRINTEAKSKLQEIAKQQNRSLSNYCKMLIEKGVQNGA